MQIVVGGVSAPREATVRVGGHRRVQYRGLLGVLAAYHVVEVLVDDDVRRADVAARRRLQRRGAAHARLETRQGV